MRYLNRGPARVLFGVVLLCALTAGCGGGGNAGASSQVGTPRAHGSTGTITGPASPGPRASSNAYGRLATQWAARIPSCSGPRAVDLRAAGGQLSGPAASAAVTANAGSAAQCELEDHTLLVLSFADYAHQNAAGHYLVQHEAYLATSSGWIVLAVGEPAPESVLSLVQGAAQALGGIVVRGALA